MAAFNAFFLLCVGMLIYLIPSVIASNRKHNSAMAILALNVLFGWTFLGWAIAFIWSLTGNTKNN